MVRRRRHCLGTGCYHLCAWSFWQKSGALLCKQGSSPTMLQSVAVTLISAAGGSSSPGSAVEHGVLVFLVSEEALSRYQTWSPMMLQSVPKMLGLLVRREALGLLAETRSGCRCRQRLETLSPDRAAGATAAGTTASEATTAAAAEPTAICAPAVQHEQARAAAAGTTAARATAAKVQAAAGAPAAKAAAADCSSSSSSWSNSCGKQQQQKHLQQDQLQLEHTRANSSWSNSGWSSSYWSNSCGGAAAGAPAA